MALFERGEEDAFPTLPAFTVPVQVQDMSDVYGPGQRGVVASCEIKAHTKFWAWTDRVQRIHHTQLRDYLNEQTRHLSDAPDEQRHAQQILLRQGFVLPNKTNDDNDTTEDYFCSNPTDAGRFMNHSANPNCGPEGTLRDIAEGEELTMDYAFHGNPAWYQAICREFDVRTEREVATMHQQGRVGSATTTD